MIRYKMVSQLRREIERFGELYYITFNYRRQHRYWINKYIQMMDWASVSENKISEKFIRYFEKYIHFDKLGKKRKLSELFIHDFYFKINMDWVSLTQKMSVDFILAHKNILNLDLVIQNRKVTSEIKIELRELNLIDFDLKTHTGINNIIIVGGKKKFGKAICPFCNKKVKCLLLLHSNVGKKCKRCQAIIYQNDAIKIKEMKL